MAAISNQEKARAARILGRKIFEEAMATATLSLDDLIAAVGAVDKAMESTPTALPEQTKTITQNLNALLPEPFKTVATQPQKSALLAVWGGVKFGAL